MGNLFDCVRSPEDPIWKVEIGHRSISTARLGGISVRLGRPLHWDPVKEEFVGDREANGWLKRKMRKPYDYSFIWIWAGNMFTASAGVRPRFWRILSARCRRLTGTRVRTTAVGLLMP